MIPYVAYRDVPGFPGYRVGTDGSVWSNWKTGWGRRDIWDWKRLKGSPDKNGYLRVRLSVDGRSFRFPVHSLILLAFVGPRPKGLVTRHLDDVITNNSLANLCYGTQQENINDSIMSGRFPCGECCYTAKLTAEKVRQIRRRAADGETQKELAIEFGVSSTTIRSAVKRITWKSVT